MKLNLKFKKPTVSPYIQSIIDDIKPNNFTKCLFEIAVKVLIFLYGICFINLINNFINSPLFFAIYAFSILACIMFLFYSVYQTLSKYIKNESLELKPDDKEASIILISYPIKVTLYIVLANYSFLIKPTLFLGPIFFVLTLFFSVMILYNICMLIDYVFKKVNE